MSSNECACFECSSITKVVPCILHAAIKSNLNNVCTASCLLCCPECIFTEPLLKSTASSLLSAIAFTPVVSNIVGSATSTQSHASVDRFERVFTLRSTDNNGLVNKQSLQPVPMLAPAQATCSSNLVFGKNIWLMIRNRIPASCQRGICDGFHIMKAEINI